MKYLIAFLLLSCSSEHKIDLQIPKITEQLKPIIIEKESEKIKKVLFSFKTSFKKFDKKDQVLNRYKNIERALFVINLKPKQEFSFNDIVGPRTSENGFYPAPVYFMGELSEGTGGGVCQLASTTYATVMMAGFHVTMRRPHSRPAPYLPEGLDATVSYPAECNKNHRDNAYNGKNKKCYALDLRFENNYNFPITIRSKIEDLQDHSDLIIEIIGDGILPEVKRTWSTFNIVPFEQKYRKTNKYLGKIKKKTQTGSDGFSGVTTFTKIWPDHQEIERVTTDYKPVDEIWIVGLGWVDGEVPWL